MAPIAVGDVVPDGTISFFDENDQLQTASVHSLAAGKKVILFGVPGAFTPTCRYKVSTFFIISHLICFQSFDLSFSCSQYRLGFVSSDLSF